MRKLQPYRACAGLLAKHNVYGKILHGWVKHLLNLAVETMYLIYKKDVSFLKIIKNGSHLSRLFYSRSARNLHIHAHFLCYNAGKCCFSKPRRPVKQHMVHRLASRFRRPDVDLHHPLYPVLPDIIIEPFRS